MKETMKVSRVDTGVITVMEPANLQHLQDFLANAKKDYLLKSDSTALENLKRIFEINTDDQLFEEAFPEEELRNTLDDMGISYKELRTRLIPNCAKKAHDMLVHQSRLAGNAEEESPEHIALRRDLCQAAEIAMTPPF